MSYWHKDKKGTIIIDRIECIREKEVRKKMAIDYREEWEKLHDRHGNKNIRIAGSLYRLYEVMNEQIQDTIQNREELMGEYVKAKIETEIIGADGGCHRVKLEVLGEPRGTITISKNAFNTWLRNREKKEKGGKVNA